MNADRRGDGEESIGGDGFVSGALSVFGFLFLQVVTGLVARLPWLITGLGLWQLLFVVPMLRLARRRGYRRFTAGVLTAAGLAAVGNAAVWLWR